MGDQEGSSSIKGQGTEKWVVVTNQSFKICKIKIQILSEKFYEKKSI